MTNQFPNYIPVQDLPGVGGGISQIQNYVPISSISVVTIAICPAGKSWIGT